MIHHHLSKKSRAPFFCSLSSTMVPLLLLVLSLAAGTTTKQQYATRPPPPPVIFDTDYGSFVDDVFALGLLLAQQSSSNSEVLLDLKLILTTSEDPVASARCAAAHLNLHCGGATDTDIPVVAVGSKLPPLEQRAGICAAAPVGLALQESVCARLLLRQSPSTSNVPIIAQEDGLRYVADAIRHSERDDWWYVAVGGQTSLRDLLAAHPDAAARIGTLIVMGGNWCAGMAEPIFPNMPAPVGELNIACDPAAANAVLQNNFNPIRNIYYVPLEVAADHQLKGDNYARILKAAAAAAAAANHQKNNTNRGAAAATMKMYRAWSDGARANPELLVHSAAVAHDPSVGVPTMFDTLAVMLALDLMEKNTSANNSSGCAEDEDDGVRFAVYDFEAVRFVEVEEEEHDSAGAPRGGYSLHVGETFDALPEECPALTNYTFEKENETVLRSDKPVKIVLGFKSKEGKQSIYREMAARIAGESILREHAANENEEL